MGTGEDLIASEQTRLECFFDNFWSPVGLPADDFGSTYPVKHPIETDVEGEKPKILFICSAVTSRTSRFWIKNKTKRTVVWFTMWLEKMLPQPHRPTVVLSERIRELVGL